MARFQRMRSKRLLRVVPAVLGADPEGQVDLVAVLAVLVADLEDRVVRAVLVADQAALVVVRAVVVVAPVALVAAQVDLVALRATPNAARAMRAIAKPAARVPKRNRWIA